MRILLVDDDPQIRLAFTAALTRRGHQVVTAGSVGAALVSAASSAPDVGVVDVMLPDGDGFSLCREIRARFRFPTIMLTARDDEVDIVGGLEAGADDYVVKPVSPAVLEARLRAVLRRSVEALHSEPEPDSLTIGDVTIDLVSRDVLARGRPLALTATELRLLVELMEGRGRAFSREELIDRVWRESPPATPRVVDTTLQRLRARLTECGVDEPRIETLRGYGYRLT